MSCHLLLVHGWGFGAGVWHPLLRLLSGVTPHALDLGYFGRSNLNMPAEPFIAVGHSLGFLWILNQLSNHPFATGCQGLVSINGFTCFVNTDTFPHGVPRRVLDRMRVRLSTNPVDVLTTFQRQAGMPNPLSIPPGLDIETLTQGLSWLIQWEGQTALNQWRKPVLAIAAEDDSIVTPKMTRDSFNESVLHWVPAGGHLLLLTRPEVCAAQIKDFMRAVS
ncbi:MAG: alpha/beta hydrolase [Magnetococcus sp. YQC-5]